MNVVFIAAMQQMQSVINKVVTPLNSNNMGRTKTTPEEKQKAAEEKAAKKAAAEAAKTAKQNEVREIVFTGTKEEKDILGLPEFVDNKTPFELSGETEKEFICKNGVRIPKTFAKVC